VSLILHFKYSCRNSGNRTK